MLLCLVVAGVSLIEGAVADSGSFLLVSGVSGPEEMCVKLYTAILSGKSVAISLRQRYGCGRDAFCVKNGHLLLAAEIPCDFGDSKNR